MTTTTGHSHHDHNRHHRGRVVVRVFNGPRPPITCLCGSTRFGAAFRTATFRLTLAGHIVLSIGCDTKADDDLWSDPADAERVKADLDELHKRKIDLADRILVLNVGGYVGESTRGEIAYARAHGKAVEFLELDAAGGGDATQPVKEV